MRIGLFTDTYFPQVSGVATSIETLKLELEKLGHDVFIFTATEKTIKKDHDPTIIRLPSIPFIAFTDRRVVYSGLTSAYTIAKTYHLDIIHTQTEFSVGIFGWMIARELGIPIVHTYHTHYEDYVHYIAKGRLIRPGLVKYFVRHYLKDCDAVICPSQVVRDILTSYKVKIPKYVIPTGIRLENYRQRPVSKAAINQLRLDLAIADDEIMLLSLSRISYEKNIQAVLRAMATLQEQVSTVKLVVVGDGPYLNQLKEQAQELGLAERVCFTGMVDPNKTALYYKAADFLVSASTSETQGLTYTESLACGTPVIARRNAYLEDLVDQDMFGYLYDEENQLSQTIYQALKTCPQMDDKLLKQKLYRISAEGFAQSVYQLYRKTIVSKAHQLVAGPFSQDSKKTYTHIKIMRNTFGVPSLVVKRTAKTSMKVLKTPKRLVDTIKTFATGDKDL